MKDNFIDYLYSIIDIDKLDIDELFNFQNDIIGLSNKGYLFLLFLMNIYILRNPRNNLSNRLAP